MALKPFSHVFLNINSLKINKVNVETKKHKNKVSYSHGDWGRFAKTWEVRLRGNSKIFL